MILRMVLSGKSMAAAANPSRDVDHSGGFRRKSPTRRRHSLQKKAPATTSNESARSQNKKAPATQMDCRGFGSISPYMS
jgi:hypothetical protein